MGPWSKTRKTSSREEQERGLELALLSLFSVVDDVMTESDAFDKIPLGFKRIYREWKQVRKLLDQEFDASLYKDPTQKSVKRRIFH